MAASRAILDGALTSRERPHERHDGYTRNDATDEHSAPSFPCSFWVVSELMYKPCHGHTQNEQFITGRLRKGAKYYGKRIAAPYGRLKSVLASQTAVHSAAASVRRPQAGTISSPEGLLYPVHAESYVWFVNTENPLQVNAILRAVPDVETLTVVFRPLPQTTRTRTLAGREARESCPLHGAR